MGKITVAYRGNFQPDIEPAQRWSTESQIALTLERLGHRVIRLQENATEWDVVEWAARKADMLLWTTTWNRDPLGALATLDRLRARGIPTVGFHLDLYWGISRQAKVFEEPFFRCDHVFTADGGHENEWIEAGVSHHWMPPAVFEGDCYTGTPHPEVYGCEVAFVGSYPYPHPEHAQARAQIVRFCQTEWRGRFRLWRGGIRGSDLADLYATAKVVIGDSCLAGLVPRYWSDRIPETLGRGGFLVHPYVEGIETEYVDGKHLRLFEAGDLHQLREIVRYYLDHDTERRAIADAGQLHVREHHTYTNRLEIVLKTVLDAPAVAVG